MFPWSRLQYPSELGIEAWPPFTDALPLALLSPHPAYHRSMPSVHHPAPPWTDRSSTDSGIARHVSDSPCCPEYRKKQLKCTRTLSRGSSRPRCSRLSRNRFALMSQNMSQICPQICPTLSRCVPNPGTFCPRIGPFWDSHHHESVLKFMENEPNVPKIKKLASSPRSTTPFRPATMGQNRTK